jgi:multicomponent Na+:H+ antiporter subunit F
MIYFLFGVMLLCMFLMLINVMFGKTIFQKIMTINCFANYTIVFLCALSLFESQESYVDIALIYALINFIATNAFLKLTKDKSF